MELLGHREWRQQGGAREVGDGEALTDEIPARFSFGDDAIERRRELESRPLGIISSSIGRKALTFSELSTISITTGKSEESLSGFA